MNDIDAGMNMLAPPPNSQGGQMTLEQAIADWIDRIERIGSENANLRSQLEKIEAKVENLKADTKPCFIVPGDILLVKEIEKANAQIRKLIEERDAWRKLVLEHNARCYWEESKILIPPALIDQP